jgi:cobalt/nickel transport system permease protein
MCGAVYIASWDAGEDLIHAMDSRCYEGKFALLGDTRPIERMPLFVVTAFLLIGSAVVLLTREIRVI